MSDLARIEEILRDRYAHPTEFYDDELDRWAEDTAAEVADALHPRIESVEQLDALPDGAVIHVPHKVTASSVEKRHDRWWPNRASGPFHHGFRDELLPARVIFTPEAK